MSDGEWMSASDFTPRVSCVHIGESAKWNMGAGRRTAFRSALSFHHVSAENTTGLTTLGSSTFSPPQNGCFNGKESWRKLMSCSQIECDFTVIFIALRNLVSILKKCVYFLKKKLQ